MRRRSTRGRQKEDVEESVATRRRRRRSSSDGEGSAQGESASEASSSEVSNVNGRGSARKRSPNGSSQHDNDSRSSSSSPSTVSGEPKSSGRSQKTLRSREKSKTSTASVASASTAKRRKRSRVPSAYYVVEHGLVHAPRRKTRPENDGETIGEALFFGDDLMFGTLHEGMDRLATPWPEYLRQRLYEEAGLRLVMSAMPGRTTRWGDEENAKALGEFVKPEDFDGSFQFGSLFSSHMPLWVIVALGTNDLKTHVRQEAARTLEEDEEFTFRLDLHVSERDEEDEDERIPTNTATFIAKCAGSIALKARRMFKGHCHEGFDKISADLSEGFGAAFKEMGREFNLTVVHPIESTASLVDGVHLSEEAARATAEEVWKAISAHLPRKTKRATPRGV